MAGESEEAGASPRHPDHDAEQAYLRTARRALDAMVERSGQALAFSERAVREENTVESRIVRSHLAERRRAVDVGAVNLCFGRIDTDPVLTLEDAERWYVGRRHIEDAEGEAVVVDWRAPVAIPFYRATAADPQDLARRRRFSCDGDELIAIFDEDLDDPESVSAAGIPDPVLAEIERGRSGEMADIVATIAAEQDEIIRAPLDECVVVQGGPGTGKTAVGLHRGAFLLFEHRQTLAESQVLVLGPNRVFLRYVANVLPSLGETAVVQATVESLLSVRVRARDVDPPAVAEIKGRPEMAEIIRRIAVDRIKPPAAEVKLPVGVRSVVLDPTTIGEALETALEASLPLNEARGVYAEILMRSVRNQLVDRGAVAEELELAIGEIRRGDDLRKLLDRTWPSLSGTQLVRTLVGNARARGRATDGLLSTADAGQIGRPVAKRIADERWTDGDLPLIDEARSITAGVGRRYGHVVVDEAQDLTAMALRAAGRRAIAGSMTVLGDIAQATAVGCQTGWDDLVDALGVADGEVQRRELTVGYRVPGPILDFANRLLPVTAPDITPAGSIRARGAGPDARAVASDDVISLVTSIVDEWARDRATVGVIAPPDLVDGVLDSLAAAGIEAVDTRRNVTLDLAVSVMEPPTAKGLEFDAAVVVEPGRIAEAPNGLRLLYVALTRAVQRLAVVHSTPLPAPLR